MNAPKRTVSAWHGLAAGGWSPVFRWLGLAALTCLGFGLAGRQSPGTTTFTAEDKVPYTQVGVQPGDTVRITFPAAQTMNSIQQVQSDGTIALPLGGTLLVKGKTSDDIQKALLEKYGSQIVVQEISVSVESAGFPVYVSGAVGRPGRVQCRQSMTVLEVVVEAGGLAEGRADRRIAESGSPEPGRDDADLRFELNKGSKGETSETFYLRPSDAVYVPERFSFY